MLLTVMACEVTVGRAGRQVHGGVPRVSARPDFHETEQGKPLSCG
jgi:hypothetical protein